MPRRQPGRSAGRNAARHRVRPAAHARTVRVPAHRGRTGARSPRRRRTGKPRRCATARRTVRWCESPSATVDPPDRPVRDRTGWARWRVAGSTAPTETARLLPAPRHGLHGRRRPRWTTGRLSRPDTRRRPRPLRRSAVRRPAARTRKSGPLPAPPTPPGQDAAPRRGAPDRPPPRQLLRRSERRDRSRQPQHAVADSGPRPPVAAVLAALPPNGQPMSRRLPGWPA